MNLRETILCSKRIILDLRTPDLMIGLEFKNLLGSRETS